MIKTEKKTFDYYNGIAKGYRNLYHNEQELKILQIIDFMPQNGLLLDLGSGDGILNKFLNEDIKIISFDLSFELLKLNQNNLRILGSAQEMPFKDNVFDCISSFTMLQDVPQPERVLCQVKRVLKQNGTFILSFLKVSSKLQNILDIIHKNFKIIRKFENEKDFIFILKN